MLRHFSRCHCFQTRFYQLSINLNSHCKIGTAENINSRPTTIVRNLVFPSAYLFDFGKGRGSPRRENRNIITMIRCAIKKMQPLTSAIIFMSNKMTDGTIEMKVKSLFLSLLLSTQLLANDCAHQTFNSHRQHCITFINDTQTWNQLLPNSLWEPEPFCYQKSIRGYLFWQYPKRSFIVSIQLVPDFNPVLSMTTKSFYKQCIDNDDEQLWCCTYKAPFQS